MNRSRPSFRRLSRYYLRICDDLDKENLTQALADVAELSTIAKLFWLELQREVQNHGRPLE